MFKPGDGMIRLGDATSHGGKVITGQQNYVVHGKPVAVVGDKVTCPKDGHGSICTIVEGHPTLRINGKQVAFHGCHTSCGAALVSSMSGTHMIGTEEAKSPPVPQPAFSPAAAAAGKVMSNETAEKESQSKIAPGFHVVREAGYRDQIKQDLLPSPSAEVDAMFERLNTHLPDYVLPGSLIVLSDPENQMCMAEEQTLQDQARLAQQTVQQLKPAQAQVMIDNWGAMMEIANEKAAPADAERQASISEQAADAMGTASTVGGVITAALDPLKSASADALDDLASLWEKGAKNVDQALTRIIAPAQKFMDQPFDLAEEARDLKAKIGVKGDKILHSVTQALEGFRKNGIPTVGEGIREAGKWAGTLDMTNYVLIALDYASTDLTIQNACNDVASNKSCRQVQFEEYGAFAGRTGFAAAGAQAGSRLAANSVCLAVGLHPVGRLTCTIATIGAGGAGAYIGGAEVGGPAGRYVGASIYEVIYGDGDSKGTK
ncbi:PAAR domain-containing protein [Salinicola rhizosphaerae]|uniref:PAAR domain-containing protein n=1 Tax=Salinicola rhizosphaerae TaxID=1443141 RepID=A0ABQ3EFD1_9GAMM|nr:PAAR domain-containing protein [Salinicola rhizosphaerae]GHB32993.1 hypothetical protein GCM10009038_34940 [Salinicola rhizosphaerae]